MVGFISQPAFHIIQKYKLYTEFVQNKVITSVKILGIHLFCIDLKQPDPFHKGRVQEYLQK